MEESSIYASYLCPDQKNLTLIEASLVVTTVQIFLFVFSDLIISLVDLTLSFISPKHDRFI